MFIAVLSFFPNTKAALHSDNNPTSFTAGSAKKPGRSYHAGISATRLSRGDPEGFPSHSREWFSIIVYRYLVLTLLSLKIDSACVT
jgi:hypothetical protein